MVTVIGPKDARVDGAINTTSRSNDFGKGLSPFFLGPVKLYGDYVSQNVENAWQYAKVYQQHVNGNGDPDRYYFQWAERGWADRRANRYPMGKGIKPLFSYWAGDKLSYVEARKRIYIPLYSEAVRRTEAYETLKSLYETFGKITLWDFDGYDHRRVGMTYEQVVNSETKKMGHAFVLAMMLEKHI